MNNNWKKYKFSDFVEINPTIRFVRRQTNLDFRFVRDP